MNQKQIRTQATIEDWSLVRLGDGHKYLIGHIRNHARQDTMQQPLQRTSRVTYIDRDSKLAQTENTLYRLGEEKFRPKSLVARLVRQCNAALNIVT